MFFDASGFEVLMCLSAIHLRCCCHHSKFAVLVSSYSMILYLVLSSDYIVLLHNMKFYYGFKCYLSTGSEHILCAGAGHTQEYKELCRQADAMHRQGADLQAPSGLASAGKATQPHNS